MSTVIDFLPYKVCVHPSRHRSGRQHECHCHVQFFYSRRHCNHRLYHNHCLCDHSYHRYRHHRRDDLIFSLICVSHLFPLAFVFFRAGRYNTNIPGSLAYHDVFVLTHDFDLQDDVRDDAGNLTSPASGVVRGLRDEQIPVCVLERSDRTGDMAGWERRVANVATAQTDRVTVAHWRSVRGLERRVVVWLTGRYVDFRVHSLSRCTTQLIIVERPPGDNSVQFSRVMFE